RGPPPARGPRSMPGRGLRPSSSRAWSRSPDAHVELLPHGIEECSPVTEEVVEYVEDALLRLAVREDVQTRLFELLQPGFVLALERLQDLLLGVAPGFQRGAPCPLHRPLQRTVDLA